MVCKCNDDFVVFLFILGSAAIWDWDQGSSAALHRGSVTEYHGIWQFRLCFSDSVVCIVCLADKVYYCLYCHFIIQWTGVLIGAAVAISFISIVAFFLHRRYKFGECETVNDWDDLVNDFHKCFLNKHNIDGIARRCYVIQLWNINAWYPGFEILCFSSTIFPLTFQEKSKLKVLNIVSEKETKWCFMAGR